MIRLFRVFIPAAVLVLIFCDILVAVGCFLLAGHLVFDEDILIYLQYEGGLLNVAIAVLSIILTLYFQDLYKPTGFRRGSGSLLVQQVTLALGALFMSQALLAYVNHNLMLSRFVLLTFSVLYLIVQPLWRRAFGTFLYKGFAAERVLFLGGSDTLLRVVKRFVDHPELGLMCVGIVDDTLPKDTEVAGAKVVGSTSELKSIVGATKADRIVVGLAERRAAMPVETLLDLRFSGILVEEASTTHESAFGRVPIRELRPSQLIFGTQLGPRRTNLRIQVIYSTLIAAAGLVILGPIMLLTALAVKVTSPGPILFRQTRVGLYNKPFTVYKFRSMVTDAEAKTGAVWATRHDSRVTTIGRFLRRTRLDELPQLFNVIRGDMSIVGPRPERPEFVKTLSELIPFYPQRHYVRPGITGWAQINYKYGETVDDTIVKLEYDLYYIKNLSFSLDFYIMFHTLKVMLFSEMGQ